MPAEGLDWMPAPEMLSDEEVLRLIGIGVRLLGINRVRLTGGEPLLRKNLEQLVSAIADLQPRPSIALTTNGIGLATRAEKLAAAGLDRINVSLDTLDAGDYNFANWFNGEEDLSDGELSRDGQRLALLQGYGSGTRLAFYAGGPPAEPALACASNDTDEGYADPSWSPDSSAVAFQVKTPPPANHIRSPSPCCLMIGTAVLISRPPAGYRPSRTVESHNGNVNPI